MDPITEVLLQYDPDDAIVMMLNYENNTNFAVDDILVGPPSAGVVRNTKVTLKVRPVGGKTDLLPAEWRGEIDFEYNRLSVSQHFNGVLGGLEITLPTSSQVLLNAITERVGQKFVLDDFVLEDIGRHNAAIYRLKAKAESLRWYGQIDVRLGDVIDVGNLLDNILPEDLGPIHGGEKYSLPNVAIPKINATPYATELLALPLNFTTQEGLELLPIIQKIAPTFTTPHLRAAFHDNAHFDKANEGWFVSPLPANVSVDFSDYRVNLSYGSGSTPGLGTVSITRSLTLQSHSIVELTYRLQDTGPVGPLAIGQLAGKFHITDNDGFVRNGSLGPLFVGANNAYAVIPHTGTYNIGLSISAQNRTVSFSELAIRSFPLTWAMNDTVDLTNAIVAQAGSGVIAMNSGGTLTYGTVANVATVDEMIINVPVVAGRSYLLSFNPVLIGNNTLEICLADAARTQLTMINAFEAQYRTGVRSYVAFTMPQETVVTQLCLRASDVGVTQSAINQLKLTTLPLPHQEDALSNPDFANGVEGVTEISSSDGSISLYNGFLRARSELSTNYGLQFVTPALGASERYTVTVRTQDNSDALLNEADHYVDLHVSQPGSTMQTIAGGSLVGWNQVSAHRFNNPKTIVLYGMLPEEAPVAPVTIRVQGRYNAFNGSMSETFSTLYRRISVEITYGEWTIAADAVKSSLYNAQITAVGLVPVFPAEDPILTLANSMNVQLDVSYSQDFSDGLMRLSYSPPAAIQSTFQVLSQLSRNNIMALEDASMYRTEILLLEANDVINESNLQEELFVDPTSDVPWVVSSIPQPKNLYGATVLYNGPIRPTDTVPVVGGLDSVLVLQLSATHCAGYKGQLRLYYFAQFPDPPED